METMEYMDTNKIVSCIEEDIKSLSDASDLRHIIRVARRKINALAKMNVTSLQIGSVIECVRKGKSKGFFRLDKIKPEFKLLNWMMILNL